MTVHAEKRRGVNTARLRSLWSTYRRAILLGAVVCMALVALPWLALNVEKLLWEQKPWGAVDLKYRYNEVRWWFAGRPLYRELGTSVYPPASYAMLWPLLGWVAFPSAIVLYAVTMAMALGGLAYVWVRESGADTGLESAFVVLMLLSMYATGFAIGHGQLTIYVLAALAGGLTLVCRSQGRWRDDLMAATLFLVALVKPTLSAPFFWLFILLPRRVRPALLVIVGYIMLTLVAISFQGFDLFALHRDWATHSVAAAAWSVHDGGQTDRGGYGDLHSWLVDLGLAKWNVPASLLMLLALGYWTYRHRNGELWLLLGITAIVARFWVYHRAYDDMLILFPMLTLFRLAKQGPDRGGNDVVAGGLLAVVMLVTFAPALAFVLPAWESLLKGLQTLTRGGLLMVLLYWAWQGTRQGGRRVRGIL